MTDIAILGFGVVGSGTVEVLTQNSTLIKSRTGQDFNIKYILDRRDFPNSPFNNLVVHDFDIILNDPDVKIVAEMMGGSHPAYEFSLACLNAGKSVVTSNKEVVANFGTELFAAAKKNNVRYLFEASVGGGIPIIRPIINDLSANSINSISGILNGTTNYILTQMENCGTDFLTALDDAKSKGYAEYDPTADIEGIDAARKIVILTALAFGKLISPDKIYTEGISKVSVTDIKIAQNFGYAIKLIAHCQKMGEKILAMVSPRLVHCSNPLYSVSDVFNGIMVDMDMVGTTMFYGQGAGKLPTASAVAADIIDILKSPEYDYSFPAVSPADESDIADIGSYSSKNMITFNIENRDAVESVFSGYEQSACYDDFCAIITKPLSEKEVSEKLGQLGDKVLSRIRVL